MKNIAVSFLCDFGAATQVLRVAYILTTYFTLPSDGRCCGIGAKCPSAHPAMPARDHEVSVFGVYCSTLVLMIYSQLCIVSSAAT